MNDPSTVKTDNFLVNGKIVLGEGQRQLATISPVNSVLYIENGEIEKLEIPSGSLGHNRYLGTDANGSLVWI